MEMAIDRLARLAGTSVRTLRYYHEIGLLTPVRTSSSGVRIYGTKEIERLQLILFYRELGTELAVIKQILYGESFDEIAALKEHRQNLASEITRLGTLMLTLERTIESREKGEIMQTKDLFEGFKENLIEENEKKYGREIRGKYGDSSVEESNEKLRGMTREDYDRMKDTEKELFEKLDAAFAAGDSTSAEALEVAELHRKWLAFSWGEYSREAHVGLAEMYVNDRRFASYYDRGTAGKTEFLQRAIENYVRTLNEQK